MSRPSLSAPACQTVPWILLSVYSACCLAVWTTDQWLHEWDSSIYVLAGQALADGAGYTYLGEPLFLRPPGFSWLLSLFVDGSTERFGFLNQLVMCFAATSAVAVYLCLLPNSGPWIAVAISLLTGTCTIFTGNFNWIVAEFPFLTLLFLSIWILDRSTTRSRRWWLWSLCGAILLATAIHLRTAGLVLLPAILLLGVRAERGWQRLRILLPIAVVVLLALPWLIHAHREAAVSERPTDQRLLFDYTTAMWHVDSGDPGSPHLSMKQWLGRIRGNGRLLGEQLARVVVGSKSLWAAFFVGAFVLIGFAVKVRWNVSLLDGVAVWYTLLLLVYFSYHPRLVLPLVPCIYFYLMTAVMTVTRLFAARSQYTKLVPVVSGLTIALLLCLNLSMLPNRGLKQSELRTYELARWLRNNTPEDAVILCSQAPTLSILSGRRAYTYRFPRQRDLISKYNVDYVVVYRDTDPDLQTQARERERSHHRVAGCVVVELR